MVETISILAIILVLGIAALAVVVLVEYYKEQDEKQKDFYVVVRTKYSLETDPDISRIKGNNGYYYKPTTSHVISERMLPYLGKVIGKWDSRKKYETTMFKGWYWEPWMCEITDEPVIISNKLEEFLRRKPGLYERFITNARFSWDDSMVESEQTLLSAFLWKDSIEGFDFWRRVEGEYEQHLKNKI